MRKRNRQTDNRDIIPKGVWCKKTEDIDIYYSELNLETQIQRVSDRWRNTETKTGEERKETCDTRNIHTYTQLRKESDTQSERHALASNNKHCSRKTSKFLKILSILNKRLYMPSMHDNSAISV